MLSLRSSSILCWGIVVGRAMRWAYYTCCPICACTCVRRYVWVCVRACVMLMLYAHLYNMSGARAHARTFALRIGIV